jgi:DNA-binding CsgD family transcriptional regulator/PAS domain-containing protein
MRRNTDLSLVTETKRNRKIPVVSEQLQRIKQPEVAEKDEKLLEKQLAIIRAMAQLSSSGVSVYDLKKGAHVYASRNFYQIFGFNIPEQPSITNEIFDRRVHPDDLAALSDNGQAATKFLLTLSPLFRKNYKLINEYRILSQGGNYIRVIEQHQVLEQDEMGNIWLSLGVIDISPDQSSQTAVKFQIMNFTTGELVSLPPHHMQVTPKLTVKEKAILELIRDGKLSKEISALFEISVHTVNTHRQRILEKLSVNNSIEAIYTAKRMGIIS